MATKRKDSTPVVEKISNPHTCWSGVISFGLITIPVRFHTGARKDDSLQFHKLHACEADRLTRLNQQMYCPVCDEVIYASDQTKGYEKNEGEYVVVTKEELNECEPDTAEEIKIEKFVKLEAFDPILYESSYYLGPDKGGERGWQLIRLALQQYGYGALAKVAMHSREHLILIRPYQDGLIVHTLFYAEEVKRMVFPKLPAPSAAELKLAGQLIAQESGTFNHADYADGYAVAAKAMLAEKVAGKKPSKRMKAAPKKSAGDDLMAALQASLAVDKKKRHAVQ